MLNLFLRYLAINRHRHELFQSIPVLFDSVSTYLTTHPNDDYDTNDGDSTGDQDVHRLLTVEEPFISQSVNII